MSGQPTQNPSKIEELVHKTAELGQGKILWNSHPIHPSTVHWPIGLITASFGLDALDLLRNKNYVSPGLDKFLPPVSAARLTSHYMGALGVIMAVPSILTGLAELYEMYRAQAIRKGNKETVKEIIKMEDEKLLTTFRHASLMDVSVAIAGYNWWTRHKQVASLALPISGQWASVAGLGVMLYGAYLGGDLVYHYAVGVQRQGSALHKGESTHATTKHEIKDQ